MRTLTVGENDGGQRLDRFLTKATVGLPNALLYKYIRKKCVKLNGERTTPEKILSAGDVITLYISDEFFGGSEAAPKGQRSRAGDDISKISPTLTVVYEDENIIICDKPVGMLVHSGDAGDASVRSVSDESRTLIGHIWAYLYSKGEYSPDDERTFAPALCHRLDRNTRGLVVAAKNAQALREMNEIIKRRYIEKYYLCAVHGTPHPRSGELHGYLLRDEGKGQVKVFGHRTAGAKEIKTGYRVIKTSGDLSLLEVKLITGRTHQIRAHLEYAGYPLLGEGRYGKNADDRRRGYRSQALAAYRVRFSLPDGYDGRLSYLSGRSFEIDRSTLNFMKEFE